MSSAPPPSRGDIVTKLRMPGCVFAEAEADLLISHARASPALAAMVVKRASGEPIEDVLGWAEFCGLQVAVEPGSFLPRRRTELLVRETVAVPRGDAHLAL